MAELASDDFKIRRDAFKKAKVLPKDKIQELHKKLMTSDDPEFRRVAGKLAPFVQNFLLSESIAHIPHITDGKFAA